MKPETAIDILRDLWCFQKSDRYSEKQIREALVLAIEALKRPHGKWIPCSERLPEKYRAYIVTDETGAVFEYDYNDLTIHDGKWSYCRREIMAWMPLLKPYKKEGEEKWDSK